MFSFFAVKPWASEHIGNTKTNVTIPKDEQTEREDESQEKEEQTAAPVLTIENYGQMMDEMNQIAATVEKSIVSIEGKTEETFEDLSGETRQRRSGVIVADNGVELLILTNDCITRKGLRSRLFSTMVTR